MIVHESKVIRLYAESLARDVLAKGAIPAVSNEIISDRSMQQHAENTAAVEQKNKETRELHLKEVANKQEMEQQHKQVK